MRRFLRASALVLALGAVPFVAVPAMAADDATPKGRVLVSVGGDLTVPAGDVADVVVVVDGDARIQGVVTVVTVVNGTITLDGGTVGTLAIGNGTAQITAGSTVTGDVLEFRSTVVVDPAATVGGQVRTMTRDLAGIGVAIGVLGVLAWIAFSIVTWAAGLALAAFGARQVRRAEWLISTEPLRTLVVGIGMVLLPPIIAVLLMATVILLPVGLALLLIVWPVLAFLGWLVGAAWIGERILRAAGRRAPERRPYLGVTLGLIVSTLVSLVPIVGAVISMFGMGAVALAGWRMLRQGDAPVAAPVGYGQMTG